jgi:hypothetical protein
LFIDTENVSVSNSSCQFDTRNEKPIASFPYLTQKKSIFSLFFGQPTKNTAPPVAAFKGKAFTPIDEPYFFKNAYKDKSFRPLIELDAAISGLDFYLSTSLMPAACRTMFRISAKA